MAAPPILTLTDASLTFGGKPLFSGASMVIGPGERLAVVGRNGSGKSTLLRIAAGLVEPDEGERFVQPGASVAYLPQDPDLGPYPTLGDYARADLDEAEHWRADSAMDGLGVDPDASPATASGGERRRAALCRMLAGEPDLMLLDEPTNHLDIAAIEWLEGYLASSKAGFAVISHDRAFLGRLTRATLWVDRGTVRRCPEGFAGFEAWRDKVLEEEAQQAHKLDRLIKEEARWAVEGISARRKRNQGRVRRLQELRQQRRDQVAVQGTAAMALESSGKTGKRVIEADGISKTYGARPIVRDFSIRVTRGERIAFVGPNGAGKTTLLNMLIGQTPPDTGTVRVGTGVEMAVFDQNRARLDHDATLWETLTGDADLGVSGANDQILVRGRPKHVVGYLKEFLFDERQARGPVSMLSGGERARLLLARIMAQPANLLVLDEPTNDLDIETLDLLQELIADFDGTVLLVSHDRDFIDRVASTTVAMEGDGTATVYAGGWSDYRAQRGEAGPETAPKPPRQPKAPKRRETTAAKEKASKQKKLGFNQSKRLESLPGEIATLETEIRKLEGLLADPQLYARDPEKFRKATAALDQRKRRLDAAEEEWLTLEALRETAEG